jgi:hypothetical protein
MAYQLGDPNFTRSKVKKSEPKQQTMEVEKETKAIKLARTYVELKEAQAKIKDQLGDINAELVMAMKEENRARIMIGAYDITVKYTEASVKVQLKKKLG